MNRLHALGLSLTMMVTWPAMAQDKGAPKPAAASPAAPAAQAAAAPAASPKPAEVPPPGPVAAVASKPVAPAADKADTPKKKRVAKRKPRDTCTKLDDPWDNVCNIQKKAQLACADLPTGKKAAKKPKKGQAPVATENRRQQCVDNYMRNV